MKLKFKKKSKSQKKVREKRSFQQRCYDLCATRKRRVWFSVISALLMGVLCYLMDNTKPFAVLDRADICYFIEKTLPKSSSNNLYDSVFFINTSHDRQLVDLDESSIHLVGNTDITNRETLLKFLNMLDTVEYKYLIIDLVFDKQHKTDYDRELYEKMLSMRNVVIANIDTTNYASIGVSDKHLYHISDERLNEISGMTRYERFFWNNNFARYRFLQSGGQSISLKVFNQLTGHEISKTPVFPIYTTKGHLCVNSPKIRMHGNFMEGEVDIPRYCRGDLGFDFAYDTMRNLKKDLGGKYIIITDLDNDKHDTYLGQAPGGYIHYEALKYLQESNHILPYWYILLTLMVLTCSLLFLFWMNYNTSSPIYTFMSKKAKSGFWKWLLTNGVLYLFYLFVYFKFSTLFNIVIPITYITFIAIVINKAKQYEKDLSNSNVTLCV